MDSDFHRSGFDRSDFNSHYLGLTFHSASSIVPATSYKIQHLLSSDENQESPPRHKAHLIPVEIFSEIFLYTAQVDPGSQTNLMLVCRHWYQIMLSTPGIHSQLRIGNGMVKKDVERFGRRWHLDVTVEMERRKFEWPITPERFFASFMTAAQAASRWRSLNLVSFPPPGEYKDLQIVLPLLHLETFKLAPSCNLGNFLEPLMTTIITTVTPRLTVMEVLNPDATPYLVQPAHLHIFSSLTTLRLICKRMQNPVDILPYFHKLETLEVHHLLLPIYSPSVELPMIQTLHILHLKSVSVQWMAGQIFPALEECSIIFPHHADAIQSVYLPSCSILKYDSNNLGALEHFHLSQLARLEVKCGQWRTWSGNLQLAALHHILASQSLTCLHLQIQCSEKLLVHMLRFVPALEELWMGLSSPHALSSTFFLAFAVGGCNATAKIGTPSQVIPPLCRELKRLHLHYKRWLRGPERKALIAAFGEIVASHQRLGQTGFSLCLGFDGGSNHQVWNVDGPVKRFTFNSRRGDIYIGFSGPQGIVPLLASPDTHVDYLSHFKELEYIWTLRQRVPINSFHSLHSLREVRAPYSNLGLWPNTTLSINFSIFHTLKVLDISSIRSSFLAGQTFHMLEGFKERLNMLPSNPSEGLLTEMPVCRKLVLGLARLVTLEVPQIRQLSVCIYGDVPKSIWENYIVVKSNLSGLRLLHVHQNYYKALPHSRPDLIKILRSLPALETLIIDERCIDKPYVDFFTVFVPSSAQETAGLDQSGEEGRISGLLCPRLESLQIQGIDPIRQPELMPVLQDIVILHATIASPLRSFTFYFFSEDLRQQHKEKKWELIGKDRSFVMEDVPALEFQLEI